MFQYQYENVLLSRLKEFFPDYVCIDGHLIKSADIEKGLINNIPEISEEENLLHTDTSTKNWHIGRILFYINNNQTVKSSIKIENYEINGQLLTIPTMVEGHHHYLALCFLKKKTATVLYSGRPDVINYLKGELSLLMYI